MKLFNLVSSTLIALIFSMPQVIYGMEHEERGAPGMQQRNQEIPDEPPPPYEDGMRMEAYEEVKQLGPQPQIIEIQQGQHLEDEGKGAWFKCKTAVRKRPRTVCIIATVLISASIIVPTTLTYINQDQAINPRQAVNWDQTPTQDPTLRPSTKPTLAPTRPCSDRHDIPACNKGDDCKWRTCYDWDEKYCYVKCSRIKDYDECIAARGPWCYRGDLCCWDISSGKCEDRRADGPCL
ncbi:MAG: hypothetical protein K0R76_1306 [Alphaproteobacteria bacterium]|nr:hypothetical protein [Alphaproteobacteria bacterium]